MKRAYTVLSIVALGVAGCQVLLGIGERVETTVGTEASVGGSDGGAGLDGGTDPPVDAAIPLVDGGCGIGLTACDDVCVDTRTNARHCGECGHDCLTALCGDRYCVPERVPTSSLGPVVTVANGEIYFRSDRDDTIIATLRAYALDGSGERDVMPIGRYAALVPVDSARWLAIDHTATSSRLRLVDLATGTVERTLFDSAESGAIRNASVHGDDVYFTTRMHVRHVRLDGTGLGVVRSVDLVNESPFGASPAIDFTNDRVYFGFVERNPLVALTRDPKPTSTEIDRAAGSGEVDYVAVDRSTSVLTWLTAGQVREVPLDGGAVSTYPIGATDMHSFARDGDLLYVSSLTSASSSLLRVDLRTHRTLLLGRNLRRNGQIAVDSRYVYMAGFDGGIDRVAR